MHLARPVAGAQGFTNQLNLFDHIGDHSSFPGRENQGAKDSESHVNYDIPKCFDYNWWLLPEERCVTVFCGMHCCTMVVCACHKIQ